MIDRELKVSKIKDGTVIDHIRGGYALDVVRILGISGKERRVMTIAINVPSRKFRVKDVVKIEGKALDSLVAPHATINIVRDYEVIEKLEVKLPSVFEGILRCINPCCISNSNEPITSKFYTKKEEPVLLKCYYCGFPIEQANILKQL